MTGILRAVTSARCHVFDMEHVSLPTPLPVAGEAPTQLGGAECLVAALDDGALPRRKPDRATLPTGYSSADPRCRLRPVAGAARIEDTECADGETSSPGMPEVRLRRRLAAKAEVLDESRASGIAAGTNAAVRRSR